MSWLKSALSALRSWLKPALAELFTLTAKNVASEVLDLINDPDLQHKALAAVQAAAAGGLKGNEAFDAAFAALTAELRAEGKELATNIRDTLIQNAYCVFRNTVVMPASQPAPKAIEA